MSDVVKYYLFEMMGNHVDATRTLLADGTWEILKVPLNTPLSNLVKDELPHPTGQLHLVHGERQFAKLRCMLQGCRLLRYQSSRRDQLSLVEPWLRGTLLS